MRVILKRVITWVQCSSNTPFLEHWWHHGLSPRTTYAFPYPAGLSDSCPQGGAVVGSEVSNDKDAAGCWALCRHTGWVVLRQSSPWRTCENTTRTTSRTCQCIDFAHRSSDFVPVLQHTTHSIVIWLKATTRNIRLLWNRTWSTPIFIKLLMLYMTWPWYNLHWCRCIMTLFCSVNCCYFCCFQRTFHLSQIFPDTVLGLHGLELGLGLGTRTQSN